MEDSKAKVYETEMHLKPAITVHGESHKSLDDMSLQRLQDFTPLLIGCEAGNTLSKSLHSRAINKKFPN